MGNIPREICLIQRDTRIGNTVFKSKIIPRIRVNLNLKINRDV